jgi:hypothetical protein
MSSFILKTVGIASVGLSMLAITVSANPWPKRGLAYNEDIPIWQFGGSWEGAPSQVNWQYNWDSSTSNKQSFAEYVPMLWSDASDHTSRWVGNANAALSSGSGHLLSFNEPDDSQQANMGVQQAANSFRTWMTPFHGRAQLGSPAVTNGGLSWLSEFLGECGDCEIDFVAVHWYDSASNFAYFTSFINQVCSIANGRQVWLTEVSSTLFCSKMISCGC